MPDKPSKDFFVPTVLHLRCGKKKSLICLILNLHVMLFYLKTKTLTIEKVNSS